MAADIFSVEYQVKLCSLLVKDPHFLAVNHSLLKPEYFNNYHIKNIVRKVYEYYKEYSSAPSKDLLSTLMNELAEREKLDYEIQYVYKTRIEEVYENDIDSEPSIRKNVIIYCKKQEYVKFIEYCYQQLNQYDRDHEDKPNVDADVQLLQEIDSGFLDLMAKGFTKDLGTDFATAMRKLPKIIAEEKSVVRTPTSIPTLNQVMGGGYRNGAFYIWVAPPGVGKTTTLISECCAAIRQGKFVVYVTFEMSESEILIKFACNLLNVTEQEMSDTNRMGNIWVEFRERFAPQLQIKYYNEHEATANTIGSFINQLELINDKKCNLLAVDYADYVAPLKGIKDSMYQDKGNSYKDLKKLAMNQEIPVLSASQTKNEGFNVDVIEMHHLEGSSMKAHIVDGMFSINPKARTEIEIQGGIDPRMLIHIAKLRKRVGYGNTEIECRMDYAKSNLYENNWDQ